MKLKKLFLNIIYIFLVAIIMPSLCFATTENISVNTDITVNAPVALLMDANTGKILYEKNAYDKMYPASTTKIMTAILALENRELSDTATVSYDAIFTVPADYTNANLQLGEELTMEQLLHVLLIPSANDAANVIAEEIGGSNRKFCKYDEY